MKTWNKSKQYHSIYIYKNLINDNRYYKSMGKE